MGDDLRWRLVVLQALCVGSQQQALPALREAVAETQRFFTGSHALVARVLESAMERASDPYYGHLALPGEIERAIATYDAIQQVTARRPS